MELGLTIITSVGLISILLNIKKKETFIIFRIMNKGCHDF